MQIKMVDLAGTENRRKKTKKRTQVTPTLPEGEHPAIAVSLKSPCGAMPLGRLPATSRT